MKDTWQPISKGFPIFHEISVPPIKPFIYIYVLHPLLFLITVLRDFLDVSNWLLSLDTLLALNKILWDIIFALVFLIVSYSIFFIIELIKINCKQFVPAGWLKIGTFLLSCDAVLAFLNIQNIARSLKNKQFQTHVNLQILCNLRVTQFLTIPSSQTVS